MKKILTIPLAALILFGCSGSDSNDLTCRQLTERLETAAEEDFAEFERTGEIPDEGDDVEAWATQYEEKDCG